MSITHSKVSAASDSLDTTQVQPSNWNADHIVTDLETTGGNFKWDNTLKRIAVGWAGVYTSVRALIMDLKHAGPTWASVSTAWHGIRVAINSYPVNAEFGSDLVACPQAITGAIDIPSTATFANHGAGLAGYARGGSTANGGVGIFGAGLTNIDGCPGAWGANFLASNTPTCHNTTSHALPLVGFNNVVVYGAEIDVGAHPLSGGGAPNVPIRGLYLVMGGGIQSSAATQNALDIYAVDVATCTWKIGVYTNDGACNTYGISLGTSGTGNNVGSQKIHLRARSSGGTDSSGDIFLDADGNLVTKSASSAITQIQDGDATALFTFSKTSHNISSRNLILTQSSTSNNVGSRELQFSSRDSGGNVDTSKVYADADGNLIVKSGTGNITQIQDGVGDAYASLGGGFTSLFKRVLLPTTTAPASASATGTAGEIRWASGFIYICVATDTWKRVAIATW